MCMDHIDDILAAGPLGVQGACAAVQDCRLSPVQGDQLVRSQDYAGFAADPAVCFMVQFEATVAGLTVLAGQTICICLSSRMCAG
jgi:hypothetical protein